MEAPSESGQGCEGLLLPAGSVKSLTRNSSVEKSLGILLHSQGNVSWKCALAVRKANSLLGCVHRSMASRSRGVITPPYSVLIRPHLECHIQS